MNEVFQDNKSAILLEKNGKKSSGKRTRAINIRYFLITDAIEKGNLNVTYCPTDEMVADFMTKGLTGTKFTKFRNDVMGFEPRNSEYDMRSLKYRREPSKFEMDRLKNASQRLVTNEKQPELLRQ